MAQTNIKILYMKNKTKSNHSCFPQDFTIQWSTFNGKTKKQGNKSEVEWITGQQKKNEDKLSSV